MTTPLWTHYPSILYEKKYLFEILPHKSFDFNRKLNSLLRLSIIYSLVIISLDKKKMSHLYIPFVVGIMTYIMSRKYNKTRMDKVSKDLMSETYKDKITNEDGHAIDIPSNVNKEELISDIKSKIKKRIEIQGYDKAKLYDPETGKYLGLKERKWIQSGLDQTKMIELDSNGIPTGEERDVSEIDKYNNEIDQKAQDLVDITDLDKLKELRRKYHIELVTQMQLAYENIDIAEEGLSWWQNPDFVNLFEITMSLFLSLLINNLKYVGSWVPSASIDIRI